MLAQRCTWANKLSEAQISFSACFAQGFMAGTLFGKESWEAEIKLRKASYLPNKLLGLLRELKSYLQNQKGFSNTSEQSSSITM